MGAPGGTGSVLTFEPARVGRLFRSGRSGRGRAPAGGAVPAGGVRRRAAKSCGDRVGPLLAGSVIPCARGARPCAQQGADPVPRRGPTPYPAGGPKTFSKKFLRTRSVSVYTSSRSSEAIRTAAWGVSSVWLERRPVTSEVAGSSPVLPAIAKNSLFGKPNRLFCYRGTCLALLPFESIEVLFGAILFQATGYPSHHHETTQMLFRFSSRYRTWLVAASMDGKCQPGTYKRGASPQSIFHARLVCRSLAVRSRKTTTDSYHRHI